MFVELFRRARLCVAGSCAGVCGCGSRQCFVRALALNPMHPEIVKDVPGMCDVCGMPLVQAESLGYVSSTPTAADMPLVIPATAPLLTVSSVKSAGVPLSSRIYGPVPVTASGDRGAVHQDRGPRDRESYG